MVTNMNSIESAVVLVLSLSVIVPRVSESFDQLPRDWRTFIDPDILHRDAGKEDDPRLSEDKFEGDIDQVEGISADEISAAALNVINGDVYRWPAGRVPYQFSVSSEFSLEQKQFIRDAMTIISLMTYDCVRFVERATEVDYINFVKEIQCYSAVGRQGGKQQVSLARGCLENYGDVLHELMHVLGFYHEAAREDRDDYIFVNWNNIAEARRSQFQKYVDSSNLGIPYDYESVMHYPYNAFAIDTNLPVIVPKKKRAKIGQNKNLSPLDVMRIQKAYGCDTIQAPFKILNASGSHSQIPFSTSTGILTASDAVFPNDCNGTHFRYVPDQGFSYAEAMRQCYGSSGRLIVLRSQQLSDCVVDLLRGKKLNTLDYWIGLMRNGPLASDFVWSDGRPLQPSDYTNWSPGEPSSNSDNGTPEYCVHLVSNIPSTVPWNDLRCSFKAGYICEKVLADLTC